VSVAIIPRRRGDHQLADVPLVPWADFRRRLGWQQGEHVTLIGKTRSGKTTLALQLLPLRRFVLVLATKPRDPLIDRLRRQGYHVTRTWPVSTEVYQRVVFWPRVERMGDQWEQEKAVAGCLESVYETGGWTIYLDEVRYVSEPSYLGLRSHVQLLWTQGRSLGVTVVAGSQRPAWVPLEAFSQADHLFLWRESDDANLKRVASIAGVHTQAMRELVPQLPEHQALYVNTVTGALARTQAYDPATIGAR
jgi:hypothetical protein